MAKTKKKKGGKGGKGGAGGIKKKMKGTKPKSFNNARKHPSGAEDANVKIDNPFEIRMHRAKHDNLGRRGRHEKGVPGVSRSKAIEKRRETLLKEYKVRNKSNVLVDKRIGEKIKNMSEEEKIIRRSVMEKRRQYKQKSIFNLPSTEEILTHKGQMLMDVDRYEDPREETDSEDERLNEEFVSDAHFSGGFLKVKSKTEGDAGDLEDEQKNRKDIIAELILNSKQRKMEKAKEADENYEIVTKLDQEFKSPDFRNLLNFMGKEKSDPKEAPPKKEDYDKIVRELHFETKTGLASNRLKTEDEIQDEELTQLQKLEKERLRRMQAQDPTIPVHRSADELADGFEMSEEVQALSYHQDGHLNKTESDENSSVEEEAEDDEEEEESDSDDAFSDLLTDDEDPVPTKTKSAKLEGSQQVIEQAGHHLENDDIPFVLILPKSYEMFQRLMLKYQAVVKDSDKNVVRFKIVTERLVKYTFLADKSRLPNLFVYLLRLIVDRTSALPALTENIQKIVDLSTVHLHAILLSNSEKCVELMESELNYGTMKFKRGNRINLGKIVFFQICSKIFCVTDFCHRILSPLKVEMLDIINSYDVNSYMGLLKVLSVIDIVHELCKDSRRYCPEVFKFLLDVLETIYLPMEKLKFKKRRIDWLKINPEETDKCIWKDEEYNPTVLDSEEERANGAQMLSVIIKVFDTLREFLEIQHKTRPFNNVIFKAILAEDSILKLNWANANFHKALFSTKLPRSLMIQPEGTLNDELAGVPLDRPKMLKLYEPLIEDNFDGNRKRKLKRKGQTQEEARLSHKVKKEMKSAAREIMKDNAFLAKQQMKEQAIKDSERNRRVKELLGSLSNQEGDYRKIKKEK